MESSLQILKDLFYFPRVGRSFMDVWSRNFLVFNNTIMISVFWIFFEPAFYLLGIGYGLGHFVGQVEGQPYIQFYVPALMLTTGMFISYFESTYSSFTKLTTQNTYQTILLTPVSVVEIVFGEISWGATKGFISGVAVSIVALGLGILDFSKLPLLWVILFFTTWIFAAFGILMCSWAQNYDWFIYSQSGLIVPMSIFCGTFFPLSQLPELLQSVVYAFPLTHSVMAARTILDGNINSMFYLNIAIIFAFATLLTNFAIASMERRILN